jgi:hypothetical protein
LLFHYVFNVLNVNFEVLSIEHIFYKTHTSDHMASKTVLYGAADGIQFETLLNQIGERHHNANTVTMSQGAGGCLEQQNDGEIFQPRLHLHPFLCSRGVQQSG